MKKTLKILLAILLVSTLVLTLTACTSSPCEHEWQLKSETAATCTATGEKVYECSKCGMTRHESIAIIAHTPVNMEGKPATCADAGRTGGTKCSECGITLTAQEVTALVPHTFETTTTAATCTTDGSIVSKCSVCGLTMTEVIPAAHTWDNGVITTPVTCEQPGERTYTCTICGETKTSIIAKGEHEYEEHLAVEPTMDTDGNIYYLSCTICGKFFDEHYNEITEEETIIPNLLNRKLVISATHAQVLDLAGEALTATEDRFAIGSEFSFKVVAAYGYKVTSVKLGEELIEASEEGVYTATMPEGVGPITLTVATEVTPVSLRLTFTVAQTLPEYVSIYFTGGVLDSTNWPTGLNAREATKLEGNKYYVDVNSFYVDNPEHLKYVLTLGFNASSGLSNDMLGLSWDYKSVQTTDTDGLFTVADGATTVDLGAHTFNVVPNLDDIINANVTLTVTFEKTLPDSNLRVWLIGEMTDNWNTAQAKKMTSTDGLTYSTSMYFKSAGSYNFKVVVEASETFSWDIADRVEYGAGGVAGAGDANVTIRKGTVSLFGDVKLSYGTAASGSDYILVGVNGDWSETTTSDARIFKATSTPNQYTIDVKLTALDEFKVKKNVSGWAWSIGGYNPHSVTFDAGVTSVANLFTWGKDNIGINYDCDVTITITDDVESRIDIRVHSVVVKEADVEWILVGALPQGNWAATTTNKALIFTPQGGGVYTLQYTFTSANVEFKIKMNIPAWTNEFSGNGSSCKMTCNPAGLITGSNNFKCTQACTVLITINTSVSPRTLTIEKQ